MNDPMLIINGRWVSIFIAFGVMSKSTNIAVKYDIHAGIIEVNEIPKFVLKNVFITLRFNVRPKDRDNLRKTN